ncbi:hypothetical protein RHIZ404_230662 [Rhizobium sp. EC-SD404]|nr:hypothetical protein RHIZ404_230662 [Rhizobium sp. EC-SD404]
MLMNSNMQKTGQAASHVDGDVAVIMFDIQNEMDI